jgi:hypothetical protein
VSAYVDPERDEDARLKAKDEQEEDERFDTAPLPEPIGPCETCGTRIFQNAKGDQICTTCLYYDMDSQLVAAGADAATVSAPYMSKYPNHDNVDIRCAGCGETPCIPDNRGCCPNRPDEEHDLSWGDYQPEPEI